MYDVRFMTSDFKDTMKAVRGNTAAFTFISYLLFITSPPSSIKSDIIYLKSFLVFLHIHRLRQYHIRRNSKTLVVNKATVRKRIEKSG